MCLSSLYLYSQKSFIIWEDSVRVDMLLKPAETDRNRGVKRERGEKNTKKVREEEGTNFYNYCLIQRKSLTHTLLYLTSVDRVCVCVHV